MLSADDHRCDIQAPADASCRRGKQGRGRPRKDWSLLENISSKPIETATVGSTTATYNFPDATTPSSLGLPEENPSGSSCSHLNLADAELLLHFTWHTGPSLIAPVDLTDSMHQFWSRNVPQLSLEFPSLMHLILSLAAHHLIFLEEHGGAPEQQKRSHSRLRLKSLAGHHLSDGLAETRTCLNNIDNTNCGALFVSSLLVCYSGFAAGPSGHGDLLLCDASGVSTDPQSSSSSWMPLMRGVRLIREAFPLEVLFTGLTAPLNAGGDTEDDDLATFLPSFLRHKFKRQDWIAPLANLRELVTSCPDSEEARVRLRALEGLEAIYEATYGRDEKGSCGVDPVNRFVFGWIYRVKDDFIACLRRREPVSLLILAYYAPLLNTMPNTWFMCGWAEHLVTMTREMVGPEFFGWIKWPLEVLGLLGPREVAG